MVELLISFFLITIIVFFWLFFIGDIPRQLSRPTALEVIAIGAFVIFLSSYIYERRIGPFLIGRGWDERSIRHTLQLYLLGSLFLYLLIFVLAFGLAMFHHIASGG